MSDRDGHDWNGRRTPRSPMDVPSGVFSCLVLVLVVVALCGVGGALL